MAYSEEKLFSAIQQGIDNLGLEISTAQQQSMYEYLLQLIKWNKAYNLSGIKDPEKMVSLHLLDSLSILPFVDGKVILDVGTGAGLPGIPIAICKPESKVILLDSNGKKTRFLFQTINNLGLKNVKVQNLRIENFQSIEQIDIVLTRAFATLKLTLEYIDHLLAPEGSLLAMKGVFPEQELQELPPAFELTEAHELSLPGENCERQLVRISRKIVSSN